MEGVECILLAAGYAQRFGGDKLLADLPSGKSVLAETVSVYEKIFEKIAIVCRPEQIESFGLAISSNAALNFIPNNLATNGISQSISLGVTNVDCSKGWLIALADMPFVQASTVKSIIQKSREAEIVRPIHHGMIGNPVYISKIYQRDLQQLDGDRGARVLINNVDQSGVFNLVVDDVGVCQDIDIRKDLDQNTFE
ncbi:MAG: nucleotidyltransferase family protein [Gammaproteobacteria bacterium]|nr:nucleotidyltransferase family protein [Gammaproteobacteria bacterium]